MTARQAPLPPNSRRQVLRLPLRLGAVVGVGRAARGLALAGLTLPVLPGLALLGGCSPRLNWRDARSPGGEIRMQLPARPASMTRRIHLRNEETEMTMIGAEVDGLAFTAAIVRGAPGESAGDVARHLDDMRDQMLRNIAAPAGAPTRDAPVRIPIVDDGGAARGQRDALAVDAEGTGPHDGIRLQGRFFVARRMAAQAIVVGRGFDELAARHYFDSLRIVES